MEEAYAYAYRVDPHEHVSDVGGNTSTPPIVTTCGGAEASSSPSHVHFWRTEDRQFSRPVATILSGSAEAGGAVAGEVPLDATTRSLSLKPGRYFVRARASDHLLEGEIALRPGGTVDVGDEHLRRIEYARLVRKGGGSGSVRGTEMGYSFHTALQNAASLCHGGFFGYPIVFPSLALIPHIDACAAQFRNEYIDASIKELGASLAVAYTHDLPIFSVRIGASAGPRVLRQDFTTNRNAPSRTTFGGQLGLEVGASADLGAGFYVLLEEALRAYFSNSRETVVPVRVSNRPSRFSSRSAWANSGDGQRRARNFAWEFANLSTNSCTGVASVARRHDIGRGIASRCLAGKRRAKLVRNFASSSGIPSARRRLCPTGYSTGTLRVFLPSFHVICSWLAIDRFFGSR